MVVQAWRSGVVKQSGRGPPSRQIFDSISIRTESPKPNGFVAWSEKYLRTDNHMYFTLSCSAAVWKSIYPFLSTTANLHGIQLKYNNTWDKWNLAGSVIKKQEEIPTEVEKNLINLELPKLLFVHWRPNSGETIELLIRFSKAFKMYSHVQFKCLEFSTLVQQWNQTYWGNVYTEIE